MEKDSNVQKIEYIDPKEEDEEEVECYNSEGEKLKIKDFMCDKDVTIIVKWKGRKKFKKKKFIFAAPASYKLIYTVIQNRFKFYDENRFFLIQENSAYAYAIEPNFLDKELDAGNYTSNLVIDKEIEKNSDK